jgi:hypothetical protein
MLAPRDFTVYSQARTTNRRTFNLQIRFPELYFKNLNAGRITMRYENNDFQEFRQICVLAGNSFATLTRIGDR